MFGGHLVGGSGVSALWGSLLLFARWFFEQPCSPLVGKCSKCCCCCFLLAASTLSHPGLLLWSCSYFFLLACFARWQPAAHIQQSLFLGQSCIALFCFSLSFSFSRMWPVCSVCSGLITAINDYKLACCLSLLVHWQFCLLLPEMPACLCVCPPPHWPFEWLVYGVCVCVPSVSFNTVSSSSIIISTFHSAVAVGWLVGCLMPARRNR